jgi:hypothetical protein
MLNVATSLKVGPIFYSQLTLFNKNKHESYAYGCTPYRLTGTDHLSTVRFLILYNLNGYGTVMATAVDPLYSYVR